MKRDITFPVNCFEGSSSSVYSLKLKYYSLLILIQEEHSKINIDTNRQKYTYIVMQGKGSKNGRKFTKIIFI